MFAGILVCACGKTQKGSLETNKPLPTAVNTGGAATGDAASEQQDAEEISGEQAFAMAEELLKGMTLKEKVGQMFMVHLSQLDDSHTGDGNQYKATRRMKQALGEYNIGGVYLTAHNIASEKQAGKLVQTLQESVSGGAMYIAVEEEGGGGNSISSKVPALKEAGALTPEQMGRSMDGGQLYEKTKRIAEELAAYGVNLNLAPVADAASEKNREYAARCLGTEPDTVGVLVENFVKGMRDGGLGTTLKYFPGIANVPGSPSEQMLDNADSLMTLRNRNFTTYSAGISAGADAIMVGSVSVSKVTMDELPAFMSPAIVTSLLREELGFDGVILSPFLDSRLIRDKYTPGFVAVEAVEAGCDMLVLSENWKESYEALLTAVERGDLDEKVINTAVQRILQNKIMRGILVVEQ